MSGTWAQLGLWTRAPTSGLFRMAVSNRRTSFRAGSKKQEMEVATFLRPGGPETYTATLLAFSAIGQRSPKACPDSRGVGKDPTSQWKVFRVFVAIFNPPQCLALNQYPINVY